MPKIHLCAKCKRDPATYDDPAPASGLFVGAWYHQTYLRVVPIRAWLCDMHADQAEHGRWVKFQDVPEV